MTALTRSNNNLNHERYIYPRVLESIQYQNRIGNTSRPTNKPESKLPICDLTYLLLEQNILTREIETLTISTQAPPSIPFRLPPSSAPLHWHRSHPSIIALFRPAFRWTLPARGVWKPLIVLFSLVSRRSRGSRIVRFAVLEDRWRCPKILTTHALRGAVVYGAGGFSIFSCGKLGMLRELGTGEVDNLTGLTAALANRTGTNVI